MYNLSDIGWDVQWEQLFARHCQPGLIPARVIVVDRDRATVQSEAGQRFAVLSGRYRFTSNSSLDLPCVGDWVCLEDHGPGNPATLHDILPRRSSLRRKAVGKTVDFQMIGANLDGVLIVQSCQYDFNPRRLERYLVMAYEGGIAPTVLLSKTDLLPPDTLPHLIDTVRAMAIGAAILTLSALTGEGVEAVRDLMAPGKTYCLVGSSGVGKTTLINHLIAGAELETQPVSATGEGRHTTVRRHLVQLRNGALLIDTPGMRELGLLGASQGIEQGFHDIETWAAQCRFSDCHHAGEPGCAVARALASGEIDPEHLRNYMKLKQESAFNDLSFAQRREKDKTFGRFLHTAKKGLKKGR
ncbi:MAG: ribosome small subunit-dependent GTPase A [Alphaproteobacteria bacterium CG_4_10_14_0_2_um_filter_63_37]|nr:MAG: ribosome small subunit-dependent GTPase A [Proteobacteria bacterium CG1_02_64_396]PJA25173.1 MAG: ribosome small subunit-dependent GTPase A [Alphaproteobacteria bacterium CG_4_10_14_0_2_um_filter_63_37]